LAKKGVGPIAKQYSTKRPQEIVTNNNDRGKFTIVFMSQLSVRAGPTSSVSPAMNTVNMTNWKQQTLQMPDSIH